MNTTCPYCGVGCGVVAGRDGIVGDPDHPANRGKLCVKGTTLGLTLDDRDRLVAPMIGGQQASWPEALDVVAKRFGEAIAERGPDSVAFYVSGQFLTEDYYIANKLMKGFIGSGNIDTNSRLCMASPVAAQIRAFGEDLVPGIYEDFDEADLILFVGSNAAWCHPVLFQRALRARESRGTRIVAIDPRRSATADLADLHIQIAPGGDLALFAALFAKCAAKGALDYDFIARHTAGFDAALAMAHQADPGIDAELFDQFADMIAGTPRLVTAFSQGVNQSVIGTDTVNAILNLHLATGRIGKPGAGPFSLTGQPNAMGGREVGGLATQLAAHLSFDDSAHRDILARFWNAPHLARKPGLKAIDLFDAVHDGRIKALWIAGTNPAESLPRSALVREALERCPFVVVADCWPTATSSRADVVLPAAGWSEKDGTVTNSERMISRQRAFRPAPGEAKPDWWMFKEVACRMGFGEAFAYSSTASIFREHAALSTFENDGARVFDLGPLAAMPDEDYDAMRPIQWPVGRAEPRLFGDGRFPTTDGRARFVAVSAEHGAVDEEKKFTLNTGRLRDQWHTMTRTGRVPELMAHREAAAATIAPADAARLGIATGDLAAIGNERGQLILPAMIGADQASGSIFMAMHWTEAHGSASTVNMLAGAERDPISGEPAFKHGKVTMRRIVAQWHGVALARTVLSVRSKVNDHAVWSRTPRVGGLVQFGFTGFLPLREDTTCRSLASSLLELPETVEMLDYTDARRGVFRLAVMRGGVLVFVLHVASDRAALPSADSLEKLFARRWVEPDPAVLLAGRGASSAAPGGGIVCVCHQVTEPMIRAAIKVRGLATIDAIGAATKAGTGCGSCISELKGFLHHEPILAAG